MRRFLDCRRLCSYATGVKEWRLILRNIMKSILLWIFWYMFAYYELRLWISHKYMNICSRMSDQVSQVWKDRVYFFNGTIAYDTITLDMFVKMFEAVETTNWQWTRFVATRRRNEGRRMTEGKNSIDNAERNSRNFVSKGRRLMKRENYYLYGDNFHEFIALS